MKKIVLFLASIFCLTTCTYRNQQGKVDSHGRYIFADDLKSLISPLDKALHKSHLENKPLLLMLSAYGYSSDLVVVHKINEIPCFRKYISDSMVDCRLIINSKLKINKIESRELKKIIPEGINFSNQGHLAKWICDNYCDSLYSAIIVVDYKMNKYSPYNFSPHFLKDSVSFMNYLIEAKHKFDSVNHIK